MRSFNSLTLRDIRKRAPHPVLFFIPYERSLLSSLNLVGLQTGSTYIDSLGSSVYDRAYSLDVGLPDVIGSSMRVAHIISEVSSFVTIKTLSHGSGTSFTT